jgi:hypothetical protein
MKGVDVTTVVSADMDQAIESIETHHFAPRRLFVRYLLKPAASDGVSLNQFGELARPLPPGSVV